ncbi:tetratricopeptide repeat protein [Roseospira goensis]|uniref:Tetratricopeptide repeat protein n=1 Tax=Roseospira goensis TaxID=391922 RepID=A0A7W6WKT5_9PROT|nr:tetratricopeptide repeat protein [Roseospira goensis]MBB4285988.1 hypothetical protein [Roseospira goensis]
MRVRRVRPPVSVLLGLVCAGLLAAGATPPARAEAPPPGPKPAAPGVVGAPARPAAGSLNRFGVLMRRTAATAPLLAQADVDAGGGGGGPAGRVTVLRGDDETRVDLRFPRPVTVTWTYENRDLVLRLDQPVGRLDVADLPARAPDVIAGAQAGYDSVLIETVTPRVVAVTSDGAQVTVRFGPPTVATGAAGGGDAQAAPDGAATASAAALRRAAILRARAQVESGDLEAARASLQDLLAQAPDNAEILALLGSVEERLNRPRRALAFYERALAQTPDDRFLHQDRRRLARQVQPGVEVGFSVIQVEDGETQVVVPVTAGPLFWRDVKITTGLETRLVDAPDARRTDGRIEDFSDTLNRLDVDAAFPVTGRLLGPVLGRVGLSGTRRGTVGLELGASADTPIGRLAATLALHEPYWGFVEALVGDGWRDRVAVTATHELTPDTILRAGAGYNRYGLGGDSYEVLTETATATLGVTQVLVRRYGAWAIEYTMDAEYALSRAEKPIRGLPGAVFEPIPIETRENHTVLATWNKTWPEATEASAYAGYTLDRFGDNGVVFGGRVAVPLTERIDITGEAARSMVNTTSTSGGVTDRFGVAVRVRW